MITNRFVIRIGITNIEDRLARQIKTNQPNKACRRLAGLRKLSAINKGIKNPLIGQDQPTLVFIT